MRIILEVKQRVKPFLPIEAESIVPKNFLSGIDGLTVYRGNKELPLKEIFNVTIEGEPSSVDEIEIVIRGESSRIKRVGEYMDGGKIHIEGDIGMHCGNFMSGGIIEIEGNADAWLGREMVGGTIICHGDAGDYCAAGYRGEKFGMKGGSLEVLGNAGDFTAETLTGGTVTIHGNSGDLTGSEMKDGTLTIMGDVTRVCGNMTGGTCYVHGRVADMLPTFKKKGTNRMNDANYTQFRGDIANRGKGTLIIKDYQYMD